MSRARERRSIEHRRELEEHHAPFTLDELPELKHPGARLCIDTWYDSTQVYILWETPETDEEWAARLAKLDLQAAKRAASADKRKRAAEKQRQEQEAAERELYERLNKSMSEPLDRVVVDGRVAVLYSPGYGSGWSTWNQDHPECVFDPVVVKWIQDGRPQQQLGDIECHCKQKYGEYFYIGSGLEQLEIEWVPRGMQFMVTEYDGSESIRWRDGEPWITA